MKISTVAARPRVFHIALEGEFEADLVIQALASLGAPVAGRTSPVDRLVAEQVRALLQSGWRVGDAVDAKYLQSEVPPRPNSVEGFEDDRTNGSNRDPVDLVKFGDPVRRPGVAKVLREYLERYVEPDTEATVEPSVPKPETARSDGAHAGSDGIGATAGVDRGGGRVEQAALDDRYDALATDEAYAGHPLRDWQKKALGAWEDNASLGVIEAITGTGKSLVGIAAMRQVVAEGGVALLLVPTRALLEQWHREVRKALPRVRVGRLSANYKDTFQTCDVLIATVQTACRNPPRPRSLGLLVADEAHRYGSPQFSKALHPSYQRRLALSGTYERQQDDGVSQVLTPYFQGVVYQYYYGEAHADRVVAPFHLALVGTEFTAEEQLRYRTASQQCADSRYKLTREEGYPEDWPEFFAAVQRTLKTKFRDQESWLCQQYLQGFAARRTVMAEASAKETLIGKIADSFGELTGTLIFTETKDSARRLAWIVNSQAPAFPLTSDSNQKEREGKLSEFGRGRLKVLTAPRILDEGVDVPEAELAIIVAASTSRRQMIQRMGRVIRVKADGRAARILVTYVKGTSEDPVRGGHEAFLEEILPFAESRRNFDEMEPENISAWLQNATVRP